MKELILESQSEIVRTLLKVQRCLIRNINLSSQLKAIKGARGTGKTTLLLQLAKLHLPLESTLYVSLNHIYFLSINSTIWQRNSRNLEEHIYYWMMYISTQTGLEK